METDAKSLIEEQSKLWDEQANFRTLWDECARYVMPGWDDFNTKRAEGERRTQYLFDGTAVSANERFAAAMAAMITPQTQRYQKLVPLDEELRENKRVNEHYEQVTKILFAARYRAKAAFTSNADECYMSLGSSGNMALFVDEELGVGIRYRSIPMSEMCWALDHSGLVDTCFRKWEYTAKAAVQKWKDKAPKSCQDALKKNPYEKFEFIHAVKPAMKPGRFKFDSWYVACKEKTIIEQGGFRTFPYGIGRYRMAPRESYGRGPAISALAAIRTLNEQKKSALRVSQLQGEPAILVADALGGEVLPFNQRPNAVNRGMVSADGRPLAMPFNQGGNVPLTIEMMGMEKQDIADAFLNSLFQILVQNPQMTATEALIRLQEKGMMVAPAGARLQGEWLGSITERELDILQAAGQLPEPPDEVIESGGYKIDYLGPINRLMRAEDGTAIMNTVQGISVMANIQPSVVHTIDWDGIAREYAEINGMPAKFILDPEDVDAIREAQEEDKQLAQVVGAAPAVAESVKNLAQAQSIARGA